MENNNQRYYFIDYPMDFNIALVIVEREIRCNNEGTKCVVKLHKGDMKEYDSLSKYKSTNHNQALKELEKTEWQTSIESV